jgi:hypothetical protein
MHLMNRLETYRSWWRPLPVWLKLLTVVGFYPTWMFLIYRVFTGASKSREALIAFIICFACVLLHIAFDKRNRVGGRDGRGIDFFGGE